MPVINWKTLNLKLNCSRKTERVSVRGSERWFPFSSGVFQQVHRYTLYHLSSKIPSDFTLHITIRQTPPEFFKQQIFINSVDDRSPTRSPLAIQWRQKQRSYCQWCKWHPVPSSESRDLHITELSPKWHRNLNNTSLMFSCFPQRTKPFVNCWNF